MYLKKNGFFSKLYVKLGTVSKPFENMKWKENVMWQAIQTNLSLPNQLKPVLQVNREAAPFG